MTSKSDKEIVFHPGAQRSGAIGEPEFLPALDDMTPREIVAELDKYIVGQNAAKRAVAVALAQSRAPAETSAGNRRRHSAQKYSDDRPDRRRQNRNRAASCAPGGLPVRQSGSLEVHGSRLRRARRGIHGARPGGNLHRHGARRKTRRSRRARRASRRRAGARSFASAVSAACPRHDGSRRSPQQREQTERTREKLRAQLREGKLDQRMVDIEVRERSMPSFEIISNQGVEEMDVNFKDMLSRHVRPAKKEAQNDAWPTPSNT